MGLIGSYNLRSMIVRKATAVMTAGGIAMVVAVFVMTLAIAQGFRATLVASGSPQNAIVLRTGTTSETTSAVLRTEVPLVESLPQVARNANNQPLTLPLPLNDFAKAYDGPPTDPKVFEEQQKKLQEELQKRADEARKKLEATQGAGASPNPAAK